MLTAKPYTIRDVKRKVTSDIKNLLVRKIRLINFSLMLIRKWEIRSKKLINLNFKKLRCRINMLLNSKILNSILTMIKEMVCYKVTLITLSMMRIIIWVMLWWWDMLVSITSTIWPTLTSLKNSLVTNLKKSLVTSLITS